MAKTGKISIIRGDTHTVNVSLPGEDLGDYEVRFTVKPLNDSSFSGTGGTTDPTAVISKDPSDFTVGTDVSTGYFILNGGSSGETDIDPTVQYYFDLEFTDNDGNVTSVPRGLFLVSPDVTRRDT